MNKIAMLISCLKLKKWDNYLHFVREQKFDADDRPLKIGEEKADCADPKRWFTHIESYDELLRTYPLKVTAKGNSDFERTVNLFDWFCENTYYNGMQLSFLSDDSLKVLRYSYKKPFSHAINCRHKAISFSDCLLALGLQSYPVCLFSDCWNHFMSQVYISELGKWCVFDPSFHTYFTNDKGKILSVFELQALMADGKQPIMHGYNFNGTQECREVYMNLFVKETLANITTWKDNSDDRRNSCLMEKRKMFDVGVPVEYR